MATILLLSFGILLRINRYLPLSFIGDQSWFFLQAREALLTGKFPLLGVTTSITWLNQGPLWTYLLIPQLWFFNFNPASSTFFNLILFCATGVLLYLFAKKLFDKVASFGVITVFFTHPLVIYQLFMSYHTAPIPLFTLIFFLTLTKHRYFLSGLFLGFLYQLHLLTFIFWPLYIYSLTKNSELKIKNLAGFLLGILPFILVGPIKTLGIFYWLARSIKDGFLGSRGISDAYLVVLMVPIFLLVAWFLKSLPKKLVIAGSVVAIIINLFQLKNHRTDWYSVILSTSRQILVESSTNSPQIVITGPGAEYETSKMPYEYLVWYLARTSSPLGKNSKFLIDTRSPETFQVLE